MPETFRYFAYGSNMSRRRLEVRKPSAIAIDSAWLPGYKLMFHKASSDGSAKADCFETGEAEDIIYGGIFEIAICELEALDKAEGAKDGYKRTTVRVFTDAGSETVTTYLATSIDDSLRPYTWYVRHVLVGATEFHLPEPYIVVIKAVEADEDRDAGRSQKELSIYDGT